MSFEMINDVSRADCGADAADRGRQSIARKISVAPMMDWTDDVETSLPVKRLQMAEEACLLYVSSALRRFTSSSSPNLPLPLRPCSVSNDDDARH
jgi:hypothetical protein